PKAWCRLRGDTCEPLVERTTSRQHIYMNRAKKGRVAIEDYPMNSTMSVTMVNLQAEDSGTYCCA
ncbi:CLM6 protein, partial [Sula dactylatra]|nr:CLM6 protein [Sula dactylatra]